MPEFVLEINDHKAWRALSSIQQGYIEALMFTEEERLRDPVGATGDSEMENEEKLENPSFDDISLESLFSIREECDTFEVLAEKLIDGFSCEQLEQVGRDLWYTSQGHGVGFWDRDETTYNDIETRDALDKLCRDSFRHEKYVSVTDGKINIE